MTRLLDPLLSVPAAWAYLTIAALVFTEAAFFVGFVLPGETAALFGGVLAATGRLSLAALLVLVVVAAMAGDSVGYELGRRLGPRVLATGPLQRHAGRLDGARAMLRERGGMAVLLARFTAFLRAVMPALAGASRMPYRRFLAYNAAGALVWGVGVVLLGYFAGHSVAAAQHTLGRASAVAGVVFAILVLTAVLVRRHRRRRSSGRPPRRPERSIEVGDEDGFVVHAVEITGADGSVTEVAIGAGNGAVLAQGAKDAKHSADQPGGPNDPQD